MTLTITALTKKGFVLAADSRATRPAVIQIPGLKSEDELSRAGINDLYCKVLPIGCYAGVTIAGNLSLVKPKEGVIGAPESLADIEQYDLQQVIEEYGRSVTGNENVGVLVKELYEAIMSKTNIEWRLERLAELHAQLINGMDGTFFGGKVKGIKINKDVDIPNIEITYSTNFESERTDVIPFQPTNLTVAAYSMDSPWFSVLSIPSGKNDWSDGDIISTGSGSEFVNKIFSRSAIVPEDSNGKLFATCPYFNEHKIDWSKLSLEEAIELIEATIKYTALIQRMSVTAKYEYLEIPPSINSEVTVATIDREKGFVYVKAPKKTEVTI